MAKCPQNNSHPKDAGHTEAADCTEDGAKRKLMKLLLAEAKKIRQELKQPCVGDCSDGGKCVLVCHVLDKDKLVVDPIEDEKCPDGVGYIATYDGRISAECVCLKLA